MSDDPTVLLARERIVRSNLEARLGTLVGENLELLVRIHELESAAQAQPAEATAE